MAYTGTAYGDISPRTAAHASKELLKRANPLLVIERFLQTKPLPANATKSMTFRRYTALALATTPLTEGVTPSGQKLSKIDITVTTQQYGDFVELTDVIDDTHEDPVLKETMALCGEQAANTIETLRFGVIKAGTNVLWANGTARTDVNTALTLNMQRKATNLLKRQNANRITSVVSASPKYATEPLAPAYIGLCHVDMESTIRGLSGYLPVEKYGDHMTALPGEIGKVEDVRYIATTVFGPWADAGGDKGTMISTTGTKADVYPIIYLGRDAAACVPLKGKESVVPMVLNPNQPRGGDPMGQRGSVAWKTWHAAVILNDFWMIRVECAAASL